ncbi:MAG: flagellar hook-associated protein FlgL [Terracidiphilus sp.]
MRVTNMVPDIEYSMQQSQQALTTAEMQVATGLRVNRPSDDPTAAANDTVSLAASAKVDQFTSNIDTLLPQLQTADSAISSVVTSLNSAITLGTEGANGSNISQRPVIAAQVAGILSTVISQANASNSGEYLFGGSASSSAPFVAASSTYTSANGSVAQPLSTTTLLTAGSITTIGDAQTGDTFEFTAKTGDTIGTLQTAIANAVAAGTLTAGTTATINASGQLSIATNSSTAGIAVISNDAALGSMSATQGTSVANAYAYVGNSTINTAQVGDSLSVSTNVPGSNLFGSGSNVIGALSGLISALQNGGTTAQIGTAVAAVSTALNNVNQQRVPLDNTIAALNSQQSYLGQETVTLTSQQDNLVGANMADAATNLAQAQTQYQAVLAVAAKVMPQTLLNYLSQPSA